METINPQYSLAISMGDPTGVGAEVTLKALAALLKKDTNFGYHLVGSEPLIQSLNQKLQTGLEFSNSSRVIISDPCGPLPENLAQGSKSAADASMKCLRFAAELCLAQKAQAMVTAPVNKESIIKAGYDFVGQTEFLSLLAGTKDTAMMLLGPDRFDQWLRVALVTIHIPIKRVASEITPEKVERAIRLALLSCQQLGLPKARVGVCGLNPHAGEGGEIGREEIEIIRPVVESFQKQGHEVSGPYAADSLFHFAYKGSYEVVVCMYHDQGLVPLKMVAFERGINWTLGLPFIRTSPDHGTAYDIAGKGVADEKSMIAAMELAMQLVEKKRS